MWRNKKELITHFSIFAKNSYLQPIFFAKKLLPHKHTSGKSCKTPLYSFSLSYIHGLSRNFIDVRGNLFRNHKDEFDQNS